MAARVPQPGSVFRWTVIVVAVANWAWLLIALPTFSDVGPEVLLSYFVLIPGALLLAAAQLIVFGWANLRWPVPARHALTAGAAAAVLSTVCWSTDWDFRCRLWLSADSLRGLAEDMQRRPPDSQVRGGRAGLFSFNRYYRFDHAWVEFETGYGFKNPHGIIYVPPNEDPPEWGRHVYGPWYRYGVD